MNVAPTKRSLFASVAAVLAILVHVIWGLGQLMKDRSLLFSLIFYLPSPVLAGSFLIAAVLAYVRRSSFWKLYAVLLIAPAVWTVPVENQWYFSDLPLEARQVHRLIHWNLCRPTERWGKQKELLFSLAPDVIFLSETTEEVKTEDFEGFETLQVDEMLIACRGPMKASSPLVAGRALNAYVVECQLESGTLRLVIADMTSNIRLWRDPYLQKFVRAFSDQQADLVAGDLNSPRRSQAFQNLPTGYRHAYETAGSGWGYTWPVPLPVFAIDQCICGPDIVPVKYTLQSSLLSDHRIQILDFWKQSWE